MVIPRGGFIFVFVMKTLILLALVTLCLAAEPGDGIQGCTGHESPFDLIDHEPTLAAEVTNGRKYTYGKKLKYFRL